MRHRTPFSRQASRFAETAQREQSALRRELRRLQDSMAGLQRAVRAAKPHGGSRFVKRSRETLSALEQAGDAALRSAVREGSGALFNQGTIESFYTSSAQFASQLLGLSSDAERIG